MGFSPLKTKLYQTGVLDNPTLFGNYWGIDAIICRDCPGCALSYQLICYKRLTAKAGSALNGSDLFTTNWFSDGNVLNTDFALYSSLEDAKSDTNRWNYCNYDDAGIGFPRDCAPQSTNQIHGQWNSRTRGGKMVTFWSGQSPQRFMELHNGGCGTDWIFDAKIPYSPQRCYEICHKLAFNHTIGYYKFFTVSKGDANCKCSHACTPEMAGHRSFEVRW